MNNSSDALQRACVAADITISASCRATKSAAITISASTTTDARHVPGAVSSGKRPNPPARAPRIAPAVFQA